MELNVPIRTLISYITGTPFTSVIWTDMDRPLSYEAVHHSTPTPLEDAPDATPMDRHAGHVRYLSTVLKDCPAISVDVIGVGLLTVMDGWHRIAATMYSGHPSIRVEFSGFIDLLIPMGFTTQEQVDDWWGED